MTSLFAGKQTPMVGIDIGSRFVKAVVLSKKGSAIQLDAIACEAISGDAFQEREIKELELVSIALKKVSKVLKTKVKGAVLAVSGPTVLTKVIQMTSGQSDVELEAQIEIEADSLIPYPINEVYLDFEELGPNSKITGKSDVLLSVAHKGTVDSRSMLVEESGFEAKIFDIESYALGNSVLMFKPDIAASDSILCLSVGAAQIQLAVVEQGEVLFSRELNYGTDMLVSDMALMYGLSTKEINEKLIQQDLPDDWRDTAYPQFLSSLQMQISRILQLYISTYNRPEPSKLLVCGGATCIPGLVQDLAMDMNMELELFDPLQEVQKSDESLTDGIHGAQFAIALGLAARSFNPCHI